MFNTICSYINSCVTCAKRKSFNQAPVGKMNPSEIRLIFHRVALDVIGPLPRTSMGNKYCIVAMDTLSKYLITKPIRSANSNSLARFLLNNLILVHGCPNELLTDNATMNSNAFIQSLTRMLGTHHIFTTPYAHRSNFLVERANRTIQECLSHYVNDKHSNWDK